MLERKEFFEKAAEYIKNRVGTKTAFWFDMDFVEFKLFNAHYGMEEGDKVLAAMEAFLEALPDVVLWKKIFSDEFVFLVLTEEPKMDEEIIERGNSYIKAFIFEHQAKYPDYRLRLSCGICPVFSAVPMEGIDNASMARKQARRADSVTAIMYTQEMMERMAAYRRREEEISQAMQEKRVVFDLQPKVDLRTGRIVGAEALARQVSPSGRRIYPDMFLDIMEENGTVVDLDFLVLEKVCEHMADRLKNNLPVVCTSVNLSRLHIQNPDTAERIHKIVQSYHISCSLLEFELTETIFLDELAGAKTLLEQLRAYGYMTSIDDFGSGYAGINLCQKVDFDVIKLDRQFLTDDEEMKRKNEAIVPCLVEMVHRLGIQALCEGVECAEQCDFLIKSGCQLAQGYYFSKPVTPEQFYEMYEEKKGCYAIG